MEETLPSGRNLGPPLWSDIHDHLNIPNTTNPLPTKVFDLWIQGTQDSNHQLIANTFSTEFTNSITSTQIIPTDTKGLFRLGMKIFGVSHRMCRKDVGRGF